MSTGEPSGAQKWGETYAQNYPTQKLFTAKLEELISGLVRTAGIDIVLIESRTKEPASFLEKIQRKHKYVDPIAEISDLSGVRVITYYAEDVEKIGDLLKQSFRVDESQTRLSASVQDGVEFSYVSDHYVVDLGPQRHALTEYAAFSGLRAEIQVRTTLQHAWASVSHKLAYKREATVPPRLHRRLSRLAALFELADEQFSMLRDESRALADEYTEQVGRKQLGIPVDALSVSALLDDPELDERLNSVAYDSGWRPPTPVATFQGLYDNDRRELTEVVSRLKFDTLQALRDAADRPDLADMAGRLRRQTQKAGGSIELTPEDLFARCLVGLYANDAEWVHEIYPVSIVHTIRTAADEGRA